MTENLKMQIKDLKEEKADLKMMVTALKEENIAQNSEIRVLRVQV